MSNVKKFEDTTMPAEYSLLISENGTGAVYTSEEVAPIVIRAILMSMCDYARTLKKKDKPIAVVIDDLAGNILFGLKVQFLDGTEDNPEGSWNPVWSFDPEDFADCDIYKITESRAYAILQNRAHVLRFRFTTSMNIPSAVRSVANVFVKWLDENAKEGDTVGAEMSGLFTVKVDVIDGKKVMNFCPDEELTNLIKDDAKLQAVE